MPLWEVWIHQAPRVYGFDGHLRRVAAKPGTDFVIHSLRHTMLTRLGEGGADAFTIMRIAGHSSVTVSQRYAHPSPESRERAFEQLEALHGKAAGSLEASQWHLLPTILTTPEAPQEQSVN